MSLSCEIDVQGISGITHGRLAEVVGRLISSRGLSINPASHARLVIGIATEVRPDHAHLIYGVEVVLLEKATLNRDNAARFDGIVESWRHQKMSGVLHYPQSEEVVREALGQEALRQVMAFLDDWKSHN